MTDDEQVERCARECDTMAKELEAHRPTSRRGTTDRQSPREIDYAIRAVRRVAERIRSLKDPAADPRPAKNGDNLHKALAILKELRPVIAHAAGSTWKRQILRRLDELVDIADDGGN